MGNEAQVPLPTGTQILLLIKRETDASDVVETWNSSSTTTTSKSKRAKVQVRDDHDSSTTKEVVTDVHVDSSTSKKDIKIKKSSTKKDINHDTDSSSTTKLFFFFSKKAKELEPYFHHVHRSHLLLREGKK